MKALKMAILGLGLAGLLSACERREPDRARYQNKDGLHGQCFFMDYDKDGDVDVITRPGDRSTAMWVAPDMADYFKEKKIFYIDNPDPTKRMTPEMQDAATRVMKGQQDFSYQLDKEMYRLSQAKKE